ncbi:MAG: integrase [Paracoccaceae bacterium]|jgi:integrase
MPLTDSQIRAFKAGSKRVRTSDSSGLFLDVMPSGRKVFRLAYRFGGKQRTALIGDYPKTRLADARLRAAEIKLGLKEGIDPHVVPFLGQEGQNETSIPSDDNRWKTIARDYLVLRRQDGAAPRTITKLNRQVGVTIEALGNRTIVSISAQDVLDVVNPIAENGHVENAHEIRSRFSQIFRYAAARGLVKSDPAAITIGAMVQRRRGEFKGITEPKEVGRLMRDLKDNATRNVLGGTALLLSAYLFPRNTELRGMRWEEIDWDRKIWEIPALRMKMKREHLVPLPKQAIEALKNIKQVDFGSSLVFPSPHDLNRMVSDNTFNATLRRLGYSRDVHVHHGFRTTASTNLNELGWNSDWIERQLAHVQTNKVRSSYNKAEYIDGRIRMMQSYADWLDLL